MIGKKVFSQITAQIDGLLSNHMDAINNAFTEAEDGLTISLPVKLVMDTDGIKIQTQISFIESRIKDSITSVVDEAQLPLFEK